jgi:hypothetical protein
VFNVGFVFSAQKKKVKATTKVLKVSSGEEAMRVCLASLRFFWHQPLTYLFA